jgi:hypothetical protein
MKKLLLILIITLTFQNLTKADDISDFEIEGISIGDSATDYFDVNEINSWEKIFYPGDVKFFKVDTPDAVGDYDDMAFHFKKNDSKFIIYELSGGKYFKNDISKCMEHKKKVNNDIKSITKNLEKNSYRYYYKYLEKGESYADIDDFIFTNGDAIRLWCVNWSDLVEKNLNFTDNFSISLAPKEHSVWLNKASKNN